MTKQPTKTFGERFNDAMDAIQRQRREDAEMFTRMFDALDRYEGRHKLRHQVARLTLTRGNLSVEGEQIAEFSVKAGKVFIKGEALDEDAALTRLAQLMAEEATVTNDDRLRRQQQDPRQTHARMR